jgi:hypothetical protein
MYLQRLARRGAVASSFVCLLAFGSFAVRAQVVPVSRHLHVQAAAGDANGSVTDNPTDITATTEIGFINHSASATSPLGLGRGSASVFTGVDPTSPFSTISLVTGASGTLLNPGPGPISGSGASSASITVDFLQDTWLAHDLMIFFPVPSGGFVTGTLKIESSTGMILQNMTWGVSTPQFNDRPLFVPAGRWTFSSSASDFIHIAGSSGGTVFQDFTIIPEPATLASAAGAVLLLMRRPR